MATNLLTFTLFVLFVCILQVCSELELPGSDAEWEVWKKFYGKTYENEYVENYRKAIWQATLEVSVKCFLINHVLF